MLFPSGNKIVMISIIDKEMINEYIPESEQGKIHFVMGTTRQALSAGLNPQVSLDMKTLVEGNEWGKQVKEGDLNGRSICGIITSPVWFCRKTKDMFHGLM
jgi:hypothetical protein